MRERLIVGGHEVTCAISMEGWASGARSTTAPSVG